MSTRVHYTKPSITQLEIAYACDAATHGWGERCYEYVHRFEALFREHLGVKHAIATSSCTGAMHMGLSGLGIGAGDEVILADINWIATVAPVVHLGATPVLVDILPDTWCIDPKSVEAAISPRTKAIVAVHLYGNVCDMDALLDIGRRHSIPVIEDAAEAIGSQWHGHRAGSLGRFGTFSFHGTKTMTTGEGGMFVTNDDALHDRVLTLSNHGRSASQKRQFWPDMVGFKYKMSNIEAAIGCGQVERIEDLVAAKRQILSRYRDRLAGLPLDMNPEPSGTINGAWMPTAVIHPGVPFDRDRLLGDFQREAIDGRVFFWPLSCLSVPARVVRGGTPVAQAIHPRAINLPSYHDLDDEALDRVCSVLREHLRFMARRAA